MRRSQVTIRTSESGLREGLEYSKLVNTLRSQETILGTFERIDGVLGTEGEKEASCRRLRRTPVVRAGSRDHYSFLLLFSYRQVIAQYQLSTVVRTRALISFSLRCETRYSLRLR